METPQKKKIKTSICLPVKVLVVYRAYYRAVYRRSERMLAFASAASPRRDKARSYNRSKDEFTIVQVYWPLEVYNKLHAVAAALRVSVSYLVYSMLMEMSAQPGEKPKKNFSNYVMIVRSWTKNTLHIEEIIHIEDDPPSETPLAA